MAPSQSNQRIAIIGSGISGLGAAYLLNQRHTITVYEKNDYIGGHARTRNITYNDKEIKVDTGFIVFNHLNYPHLTALFKHLCVPTQKSVMSFSVVSEQDNLEWGAESPIALFGQKRNLLRPKFYRFLLDILKFNRLALRETRHSQLTLEELIARLNLGDWFRQYYILPMGGAIWSCSLAAMLKFPAKFFVDFFQAHGLLTIAGQPQWHTVTGGSVIYIEKITENFKEKIKTSCGVSAVTRQNDKVQVVDTDGTQQEFDAVIFATPANETLALLRDATEQERTVLSAFQYQKNTAVLHKSVALMPRRRACWGSWVYNAAQKQGPIGVTYWMNHLQGIDKNRPLFVTLNPPIDIPESDIFERHVFYHPIYNPAAVAAQKELTKMQGQNNTWMCGAYMRNGFHEDGLASAIDVAAHMGVSPPWQ